MTLILSGTDGLSDIDGSAATPAIRGTDANTGIFFGTDIIGFSEGGAEVMRIDSSGNVGIGTTSPTAKLDVSGTAKATNMSLNGVAIGDYNLYSGMVTRVSNGGGVGINSADPSYNAYIYFGSGTSSAAQQSAAIGRIGGDVLAMFTASAERMRIDSSGNVGIGTSSPTARLHSIATSGTTTTLGRFEAAVGSYTGTSLIACNTLGASSTYNLFSCITDSDGDAGGPFTEFSVRGDGLVFMDSGYGSAAAAYGCRAWISFNGTGTPAIRGSGNISSITDNGTGDYTINFSTALTDANYSVSLTSRITSTGIPPVVVNLLTTTAPTASLFRICTDRNGVGPVDPEFVFASVFR